MKEKTIWQKKAIRRKMAEPKMSANRLGAMMDLYAKDPNDPYGLKKLDDA